MLLITYSQVRMTNDLSTICKPIQTEVYLYITCIRIGKYNHRDHVASNAFKTYECSVCLHLKGRERESERGSGMANSFSSLPYVSIEREGERERDSLREGSKG